MGKVRVSGVRMDEVCVLVDLDEWDEDTQKALLDRDHPEHHTVVDEFLNGQLGGLRDLEVHPVEIEDVQVTPIKEDEK